MLLPTKRSSSGTSKRRYFAPVATITVLAPISRPSDRLRIFLSPSRRNPVASREKTNFAPNSQACWWARWVS